MMSHPAGLRFVLLIIALLWAGDGLAVRIGHFVPEDKAGESAPTVPDVGDMQSPQPLVGRESPASISGDPISGDRAEAALLATISSGDTDLDLVYRLAQRRAELAIEAYESGDQPKAFDYLVNALQLDPAQPERWERLGDWGLALASDDGETLAHQAWSQALGLQPDHPRVRLKLAALFVGQGRYPDAIPHFEAALASPRAEVAWNHLILLVTVYIRADQAVRGLDFLQSRFDRTGDERYLLAEAVLMDALGQGTSAARLAGLVIDSQWAPAVLRQYAQVLQDRFIAAGDRRLSGELRVGQGWLLNPGGKR